MNANDPNQSAPQAQKSSAKPWIIGGCGCLTLLAIIAAVAGFFMYKAGKGLVGDMIKLGKAAEVAMQAPEVIDAFGTPIEHVGKQEQSTSKEHGKTVMEMTQTLKGPKGEGKLIMIMEQTDGTVMPKFKSAKIVTPTGNEIPIKLNLDAPATEGTPAPASNP